MVARFNVAIDSYSCQEVNLKVNSKTVSRAEQNVRFLYVNINSEEEISALTKEMQSLLEERYSEHIKKANELRKQSKELEKESMELLHSTKEDFLQHIKANHPDIIL
jgi:uncharacterized protein YeeX (DUF496 family)